MPRSLVYNRQGGIDVLELVEVTSPDPQPGTALVSFKAAGLNPFDFKLRSGIIPMPVEFPKGIGTDFAGVVEAVGADTNYADGTAILLGDEVLGWCDSGSLCEKAVVPATTMTKKPQGLSWELAGSLTTAALTAQAAIDLMKPAPGDTIVVSAAAGAVGLVYCQLALRAGARVIGTASQANHDYLRALGVEPVTYGADLAEKLTQIAPEGISYVQDNWGREFIDVALSIGIAPEKICTIVDHAATAELGLSNPGRYERSTTTLHALAEQFSLGELVLPIQQVFSLDDFAKAFALLESRHLRGKVVITP